MYTFNLFCFGHRLAKNKELNNSLHDWCIEFNKTINGKNFEVSFPYHGGQVRNDCYSCVFGIIISDDDNPDYVNNIKSVNELDYLNDYNEFLRIFFHEFESDTYAEHEKEILEVVKRLKKFIIENKPEFYTVEISS